MLVALATGGSAPAASAIPVRVFAVGSKVDVRYADTYQNFRDKMFALVDAGHPRRDELVQRGVDDVASHLPPGDTAAPPLALVNFPEDVGLVAAFIGTRGARARRANTANGGSTAAFGALILAYGPQIDYYVARFPGLPPVRYLLLAETDTFYRGAYETFRDLARTYGVYLTATFNVAAARRVEAAADPELVALLRDPDEAQTRSYAYVAESPDVFNTTFVFDPAGNVLVPEPDGRLRNSPAETDGVLRGSLNKAYLTEAEQDLLPLSYGRVRDLDVLDTPVGRLASVISKDAWMIDVNDRYDAKGANLVLQPEAFSEWAYVADPWQPDGYKAGGFAQVQRNPSFLFNVAPSMTGNLVDVTFDGQSSIVGKRRKGVSGSPQTAWIGQNPDSGFLRVAPWIMADPGLETAGLTVSQRRAQLADAGAHLLPGALPKCATPLDVGPCQNGYREAVIHADIDIPVGAVGPASQSRVMSALPPRGESHPVAARSDARQYHPRVVANGGRVYAVWEERTGASQRVVLAVSADRGEHFVVGNVSDNVPGTVTELRPVVAASRDGDQVYVAWQEFCAGWDDDCGRIMLARFDATGRKLGGDVRVDSGADGVGKWNPTLAVTGAGQPLVAWVDERDGGPDGVRFEHIYFARGRQHGEWFTPSVRVDRGAPVRPATALDNKWAPTIAARGRRIVVAWSDFRNYNWDVYAAHSHTGAAFSTNVRVDDSQIFERINDHPSLAIGDDGVVHAVWADRRDTAGDTNVFYARSIDGSRTFANHRQIDGSAVGFDPDRDTPSHQWHPRVATIGSDVVAVWQDNRLGDNDIFSVRSQDRGGSFALEERVDDSADAPGEQTRPDVAVDGADQAGRSMYVIWEDDRTGTSAIRVVRRELR